MHDQRLLTLKDAARRFAVSTRTVRTWISTGRLKVLRMSARCLRVEESEIQRLLRELRK